MLRLAIHAALVVVGLLAVVALVVVVVIRVLVIEISKCKPVYQVAQLTWFM